MKQRFFILLYLLVCHTMLMSAQGYSSEEIKANLNTRITAIKIKIPTIKDLFELKKIKISEYGDLEAYYSSYSKYLEEADKESYGKRVKSCKGLIDVLENELNTNLDETATEIEKLDEKVAIVQTLSEGESLQYEFDRLRANFDKRSKNNSSLSAAWVNETKWRLDNLATKISKKRRKLSEEIAIETNFCRVIPLDWVIAKKQSQIKEVPSETDKAIDRISEILKKKYDINNEGDADKKPTYRQKKLTKKLEKLQLQAAIERAENTEVMDTESLAVLITFCQKKLMPTKGDSLFTYWGISGVNLPKERQTDNRGGLSYTFSSEITSKRFSERVNVQVELTRGKVDDLPTQQTRMNLIFVVSTNPETGVTDITIEANPEDKDALGKLGYKDVKIPDAMIYFDSNWKDKKQHFIHQMKERLNIQ